jgi:5-methylcytosine-specific restriction endonuclease McrA
VAMTIVLNSTFEVLASVPWQRAVTMVVTGDAEIHEADPSRLVRSAFLTLPFPRVVRLRSYVYVRFVERASGGGASKKGVLLRDRRTCIYCGRTGDTIDHLQPQSRRGLSTWENMAACCRACNHRKADRTPEEAGMRPRWVPWQPDPSGRAQRMIWKGLEPLLVAS